MSAKIGMVPYPNMILLDLASGFISLLSKRSEVIGNAQTNINGTDVPRTKNSVALIYLIRISLSVLIIILISLL